MVEVVANGVPRRVHVWISAGETFVSFPEDMLEVEATSIVSLGLAMLKPLDVAALFEGPRTKRRRHIEVNDD